MVEKASGYVYRNAEDKVSSDTRRLNLHLVPANAMPSFPVASVHDVVMYSVGLVNILYTLCMYSRSSYVIRRQLKWKNKEDLYKHALNKVIS